MMETTVHLCDIQKGNNLRLLLNIALILVALATVGVAASGPAAAQRLDGTTVTGVLDVNGLGTNFFDPAYGYVPAGFANKAAGGPTVTITEAQVEFGFSDLNNTDTADFIDNQLILKDVEPGGMGSVPIQYTFTDDSFTSVTLNSNTFIGFDGTLTYSLTGNKLTINTPDFQTSANFEAIFDINSTPVPELPTTASLALLLGLGSVVFASRRRKT